MLNDFRNTDIEISRADPVCGKDVSSKEALSKELFYIYEQKEYLFCSVGCLKQFLKAPRQYVSEEIPGEFVYICEACHKKFHKNADFSTMIVNGVVHKFCRPTCAVVFDILIEVSKLPIPELQKH